MMENNRSSSSMAGTDCNNNDNNFGSDKGEKSNVIIVGNFGSMTLIKNSTAGVGGGKDNSLSGKTSSFNSVVAPTGAGSLEKALFSLKNLEGGPVRSRKMELAPRKKSVKILSGSVLGQTSFSLDSLPPQILAILSQKNPMEEKFSVTRWLSAEEKTSSSIDQSQVQENTANQTVANGQRSRNASISSSSSSAVSSATRKKSRALKSTASDEFKSTSKSFLTQEDHNIQKVVATTINYPSSKIFPDASDSAYIAVTGSSFVSSIPIQKTKTNNSSDESITNNASGSGSKLNVLSSGLISNPFQTRERVLSITDSSWDLRKKSPANGSQDDGDKDATDIDNDEDNDIDNDNDNDNDDGNDDDDDIRTEQLLADDLEDGNMDEKFDIERTQKPTREKSKPPAVSAFKRKSGKPRLSGKKSVTPSLSSKTGSVAAANPIGGDSRGFYQITNYNSSSTGLVAKGRSNHATTSPAKTSSSSASANPSISALSAQNLVRQSKPFGAFFGSGNGAKRLLDPLWNEIASHFDCFSGWSAVPRDPLVVCHAFKSKPPIVYSYCSTSISVSKTNGTASSLSGNNALSLIDPINRHFRDVREVPESFYVNLGAFIVLDDGWSRLDAGRSYRTCIRKTDETVKDRNHDDVAVDNNDARRELVQPIRLKSQKFPSYNKWSQKVLWNIRRVKNWWPWISDKTCAILEKRQWRGPLNGKVGSGTGSSSSTALNKLSPAGSKLTLSSSAYSGVSSSGYGSSVKKLGQTTYRLGRRYNRSTMRKVHVEGEEEEDEDENNDRISSHPEVSRPEFQASSSSSSSSKGNEVQQEMIVGENSPVSAPITVHADTDVDAVGGETASWNDNFVKDYATEILQKTIASASRDEGTGERQQLIPRRAVLATWADWSSELPELASNAPGSSNSIIHNHIAAISQSRQGREAKAPFIPQSINSNVFDPFPDLSHVSNSSKSKKTQLSSDSLPPLHVSSQPNCLMMKKAVLDARMKRQSQITAADQTMSSSSWSNLGKGSFTSASGQLLSLNGTGSITLVNKGTISGVQGKHINK